jgi:hypothetical protein
MTATAPFVLTLKSTLDKVVYDLATASSLLYIDLDGAMFNSGRLLEAQNAIAWALTGFSPYHGNPYLFDLSFEIAAVTAGDPAAFTSFDIVGILLDAFPQLKSIDVYDYTGAQAGSTKHGTLTIIDAQVQPLQSNDVEGLRSISVTAKGSRSG